MKSKQTRLERLARLVEVARKRRLDAMTQASNDERDIEDGGKYIPRYGRANRAYVRLNRIRQAWWNEMEKMKSAGKS